MSVARELWRVNGFRRWLLSEAINLMGSTVSTVVLPLLVFERTGSAALTAGLLAVRVVPYLAVGVVAGPLADRGDQKKMLVRGNVVQGVAMATIPLWDLVAPVPIVVVYVASLIAATGFVFSDAAAFGALPRLVPLELLPTANGWLSSLSSALEVTGPAVGALLAGGIGAARAVGVDAASFFVAAALLFGLSLPPSGLPSRAGESLRSEIRAGFAFVRRDRVISTLIAAGFGNSLAYGAVVGLLVVYAVRIIGLSESDVRVGLLFSAGAVGSLAAGLMLGTLYRAERIRWLTPMTMVVSGLVALVLAGLSSFVPAAATYLVLSALVTTTIIVGITYRMAATPAAMRSRVNVIGRMVAWGGQPFGAALGGVVAQEWGVARALEVAAAVFVMSGVGARLLLRRTSTTAGDVATG